MQSVHYHASVSFIEHAIIHNKHETSVYNRAYIYIYVYTFHVYWFQLIWHSGYID